MALKCPECDYVGLLRDFEYAVVTLAPDHQEPGLTCSSCGMVSLAEKFVVVETTRYIRHRRKARWVLALAVLAFLVWLFL